ncbi:MAG: hypothetical protein EA381_13165 [Planctomycetaceae bacterium]|nr:MAG: hypothetical protein EA381_13165 [Planctomycetaceae bacterium]
MPIAVTCPKCLTRFSVSEKFAGKKGPCPKCKFEITVPELSEQVVIHAPPDVAPKDSKGQSVLKPIKRREVKIGRGLILGSVGGVVGAIGLAIAMRLTGGPPAAVIALVAVLVAPPLVRFGYAISRDSELEPFYSTELLVRVLISSAVLVATWLIYVLIAPYVFDYDRASELPLLFGGITLLVMLGFGSVAAMLTFELEFSGGLIIAGVYLTATLALALIAGVPLMSLTSS